MHDLDDFVLDSPRPLPVIILADTSGSMDGPKIASLNAALKELVQDLAGTRQPQGEIHLAVIAFDNSVRAGALAPASDFKPEEFVASGRTAMGAALDAARAMIGDPEQVPSRAYTPTLVLISDGVPTDHFDKALRDLMSHDRAKRATRMALAIGADANVDKLKAFVADPEVPVMRASEVAKIRDFFRWVTFSVQARSRSRDPNQPLVVSPEALDISTDDLVF